jgi:hypothetical protein
MTARFIGSNGGNWLHQKCIYAIQSIYIDPNESCKYRILANEPNTPALFPAVDFEIVDGTMPPSWVVYDLGNRKFVIGPAAWTVSGFWERYFDDDQEARQKFEIYCTRIDK